MRNESRTTSAETDPGVDGTGGAAPDRAARALDPVRLTAVPVPRRRVLKVMGVGGLAVLVAGTGALGFRTLDTAAFSPSDGHAYDPWRLWRSEPGPAGAVAAAVLAANPHNTQPWMFAFDDASIDIYRDPTRHIGAVDPFRREQHLGLGCALENLLLACRVRGLRTVASLMPDGAGSDRVAHVSLASALSEPSPLYEAIGDRHTNRGPYDGRPVTAEARNGLVDPTGLPGVEVNWISEPGPMADLGDLLVDAALAITQDEQQSVDGFAWFRDNTEAIQQHRDGLTLDAQGMAPLTLAIAKVLPASSRGTGDAFWVDQTRKVQTRTAAAYGILTAADVDDRSTQLIAGRLLQRVHLTATVGGIALQHMNQITERIDRERVAKLTPAFGPRLSALLPPGAHPLAVFRIGHPVREALPSPRRPVGDVVR